MSTSLPNSVSPFVLAAALTVGAATASAAPPQPAPPPPPRYTITPLGTFDGGPEPRAINAAGTVAGNLYSPDGTTTKNDAFVQARAGPVRILPAPPGAGNSVAIGLNDNNWVIGNADNVGGVIWTPQGPPILLGPTDTRVLSQATAINNRNQVVGVISGSGYRRDPDGRMTHLGGLPGGFAVTPLDISDAGYVGGSGRVGAVEHAFVRTPDGRTTNLGDFPGGDDSSATFAVNDRGHAAGVGSTFSGDTPFFWSEETGLVNLGGLPTVERPAVARDINNDDWVVGDTLGYPDTDRHAFLWTPAAGLHDLNELLDPSERGWAMNAAWHVTDQGDILGLASRDGVVHFVLASPVPEPAGAALFTSALAAALLYRWRPARATPPAEGLAQHKPPAIEHSAIRNAG